jgi:hypothetical protein
MREKKKEREREREAFVEQGALKKSSVKRGQKLADIGERVIGSLKPRRT